MQTRRGECISRDTPRNRKHFVGFAVFIFHLHGFNFRTLKNL